MIDVSSPTFDRVMRDVFDERVAQDAKWGVQNHDPITWMAVLAEEVGELSEQALNHRFTSKAPIDEARRAIAADLRAEAVQVAAVAVAIIECCDRNGWGS